MASPHPEKTLPPIPQRNWLLLGLFLLVAAILRFLAAQGELWLDEVWSLQMVRQLKSPLEILFRLRIDNNHLLNSFWLDLLPVDAPLFLHRLFPVLCGIGSLFAAVALSRPRGWGPMVAVALCTSASCIMVHYSTEARGYAPLMFFLFLSLWARQSADSTPKPLRWNLLYALSCSLGFFSHASFLQFFAPAALIDLTKAFRKTSPTSAQLLFLRILLPSLCFGFIWLVNLRGMAIGGGNESAYLEVILETLAIAVGAPPTDPWLLLGAFAALILLGCVIWHLLSISLEVALLFLGATILMPALLLVLMGRQDIYPRYFLIGILLFQWGLGDWIGSLLQNSSSKSTLPARPIGILLLSLFIAANLCQDFKLIRLGRSHYLEMLAWIAEHSPERPAVLAVDHPFRQGMMLGFYLPRTPDPQRIQVYNPGTPSAPPEWILLHGQEPDLKRNPTFTDPQLGHFELQRVFPASKLSGWDLLLYRKQPR